MSIELLRKKIDRLDEQILKLLSERAVYALEIGKEKNNNNLSILSEEREQQIIENLLRSNSGPLCSDDIRAIFMEIITACRKVQQP